MSNLSCLGGLKMRWEDFESKLVLLDAGLCNGGVAYILISTSTSTSVGTPCTMQW